MKKLCLSAALAAIAVLLIGNFSTQANNNSYPKLVHIAAAASNDDAMTFRARLRGINETPGPVATQATGSFTATLSSDGSSLSYTVSYTNLNAQVLFSHIHFAFLKKPEASWWFSVGRLRVLEVDRLSVFPTPR